jgi:hypothetical protein
MAWISKMIPEQSLDFWTSRIARSAPSRLRKIAAMWRGPNARCPSSRGVVSQHSWVSTGPMALTMKRSLLKPSLARILGRLGRLVAQRAGLQWAGQ